MYYGITDNWQRIIENKVLRDEVADMPQHRKEQSSDLNGLAYRMRKFLPDVDDAFFVKLTKERSLPPEPIIWRGHRLLARRQL